MDKREQELMRDLSEAKPACPLSEEEWAESEEAKRILSQVLASPPPKRQPPWPWFSRPAHLAWIGGLVAVIALGLGLGLSLLGADPPPSATGPETTAATMAGPAAPAEVVSVTLALEHLVAMAHRETGTIVTEQPSTADTEALVKKGAALGLFAEEDGPGMALSDPVTRAQFVLWVWRAFGPRLPADESREFSDLGRLSPEEQEAVRGLAQAGVVEPYPDGTFRGRELLSVADEVALLRRVQQALE